MNNLSWFIYLTQLVDNMSGLMVFAGIVILIWCVVRVIIAACRGESAWINTPGNGRGADLEAKREVWKAFNPKIGLFVSLSVVCFAIAAALPSRKTMILIAGSEIGERAMASNEVKEIVNPGMALIKNWIKAENDKLTTK